MLVPQEGDVAVFHDRGEIVAGDLLHPGPSAAVAPRRGMLGTHLEQPIRIPQSGRQVSKQSVQTCCRIACEEFRFVQLEDGEGDAEEKDGAVDEEEVPNSSARKGLVSGGGGG